MTRAAKKELKGCLSLLLCLIVLIICVVWFVFSNYWPQALVAGLLAIAIILERSNNAPVS